MGNTFFINATLSIYLRVKYTHSAVRKRQIWEGGRRGVPKAEEKAELWERIEGA